MGAQKRSAIHTFDIDNYLNPITPRSRLYLLPRWISFWFGYREPTKNESTPAKPAPSILLVYLGSFLGAFIGISIIENVFRNLPRLDGHPVPLVIASFGAAAILEYNAIESPLSQPRNLVLGHLLSAAVGVGITKLFHLLPEARFEDLRWLAGALSVGCASTVMGMTKTVHPPAGATALLAATSADITDLGWWLLALVVLAAMLMLVSAMIVNNLYKRFPLYWWTPVDLAKLRGKEPVVSVSEAEKGKAQPADSTSSIHSSSDAGLKQNAQPQPARSSSEPDAAAANLQENTTSKQVLTETPSRHQDVDPEEVLRVELNRIVIPDWMSISEFETEVLEGLQSRLREGKRQDA